jgi:hypothetical protein
MQLSISYANIQSQLHMHACAQPKSTSPLGRIVQGLSVLLPLRHVHTHHAAVISHQAVDLALDIRSLGPHGRTAGEPRHLVAQQADQHAGAVVVRVEVGVDFVRVRDGVNGGLDGPETGSSLSDMCGRAQAKGLTSLCWGYGQCLQTRLEFQYVTDRKETKPASRMVSRTAARRSDGCPKSHLPRCLATP